MPMIYGNPPTTNGTFEQLIPFWAHKKALTDIVKEKFFGQLADTIHMPKHYGKTIKMFHYVPLLDDRNINDQGIDATGNAITDEVTITVKDPSNAERFYVGSADNAANALDKAKERMVSEFKNLGIDRDSYDYLKQDLENNGWVVTEGAAVNSSGNLYASSKDVGTITKKLPVISETGGRVNRVGFTRLELEANIENFGFFDEYTEDAVQFDNDKDLLFHISRETLKAANEIYEDTLQNDLLNGAKVVFYGGNAISMSEVTGEQGVTKSVLTYETLAKVEKILNDNRCPKDTTIITGTRMVDTRTIGACRYAFVGSELKLQLLKMKDFHGNAAFIPVQQYAEAGKVANGEIGSIGNFRFIENPDMHFWEGAGASEGSNDGYMTYNGKYNVYPVLIVGDKSFSTIGFQTSEGNTKFKIYHKKPGEGSVTPQNPYGKKGLYSIQWWYGTLIMRPEWIACIKVVAER